MTIFREADQRFTQKSELSRHKFASLVLQLLTTANHVLANHEANNPLSRTADR